MNLLKLFGFGAAKKKESRCIGTVLEFQAVLHRETARANRRNAPLSLVLIETSDKAVQFLGAVAFSRLRLSDEVGWHTPTVIGILLPDTASDGARKLIDNLDAEFSGKHKSHMTYTIRTYPCPEWPANI